MPVNGKIFISYSWSEPSGSVVNNWLKPCLKDAGITCMIDKDDCGYNGNFVTFERELPLAAKVVLVVSPAFLFSPECMFKAAFAVTKCDVEKQVFVINLMDYDFRKDDKNLLRETSIIFENRKMKVQEAIEKLPDSAKGSMKDELRKINTATRDQILR